MQEAVEPVKEAVADTLQTPQSLSDLIASMESLTLEDIVDKVVSGTLSALASIVLAVIVFYVGRWLIKKFLAFLEKSFAYISFTRFLKGKM